MDKKDLHSREELSVVRNSLNTILEQLDHLAKEQLTAEDAILIRRKYIQDLTALNDRYSFQFKKLHRKYDRQITKLYEKL